MTRPPVPVLPAHAKLWVTKRDGRPQKIHSGKIAKRLERLCYGLDAHALDISGVCFKVVDGMTAGVATSALDSMAAKACAALQSVNPDYGALATRIQVNNMHKETPKKFSKVVELLHENGMLSSDVVDSVRRHAAVLDSAIIHDRDSKLTYAGLCLLEERHLARVKGRVVERPQHMFMRAAISLHVDHPELAIQSYDAMSRGRVVRPVGLIAAAGSRSGSECNGQPAAVSVALSHFVIRRDVGAPQFDHDGLKAAVAGACQEMRGTYLISGCHWEGVTAFSGLSTTLEEVRGTFASALPHPWREAPTSPGISGECLIFGHGVASFTMECQAA
jgi:hypothetical protein